ncbi:MAG: radical SAM family heme chaperone HemW [Absicoccus porci]|uniref:radical SAM family heme chaperone HemW n=1 Tax=Absicoccus porci TaxID=2486576 RepID=UPI002E766F41|nr:radical SAM family heme chaperone HemW [Absicoccus porci]MEE1354522.1 radical SAM family heme chaperone HemW [Absicoccus porci]
MHVYVHIPFCESICAYCDFYRYKTNASIQKQWFTRILEEIDALSFSSIDTLYFGGGTPSSLANDMLVRIAEKFIPYLAQSYEWTIECNPETLTQEKIRLYANLGINRISLGVQSFQLDILHALGRKHTLEDIFRCIQQCRDNGIHNISIDLMYGLPHQTLKDLQKDIDIFLKLDLPHLSIYSLQIEPNSIFGKQGVQPCDPDLEADMYERIRQDLTQAGYEQYEISSYCKEGMYSRHNLCYWDDSDFLGIGCGASGRIHGKRYDQNQSLQAYIQNGAIREYVESDPPFEAIMMSLRTAFGLDIQTWNQKYQRDFEKEYQRVLKKYAKQLKIRNGRCVCTPSGLEILNTILVEFLEDS